MIQKKGSLPPSLPLSSYSPNDRNQSDDPMTVAAFQRSWIDAMMTNAYDLRADVKHLFIAIDPSGGNGGNLYVLTSMVFSEGNCIVCLLLSHANAKPVVCGTV